MQRVFLVALLLASAAPLQAQATARDSVLATIHAFLDGMRTRDTALMSAQIDTFTRITLLRPTAEGGVRVLLVNPQQFIAAAARQPNGVDEPIRNAVVHVDGPLATVWAEYQVRAAGKVTHCGYDSFQLAKLDNRWKILSVSDSFRRTGCGDPWPIASSGK